MELTLLDWRRRVAGLYSDVRANSDPQAAHNHWRATRDRLLREHPDSPVPRGRRRDFSGAAVAPYDPHLRFQLEVDTRVAPRRLQLETGPDGPVVFDLIGRLHVPAFGGLDVWWLRAYGGGLFVPFKDATAGSASYGGGRYLIDTVKGADLGSSDHSLVVDFNFGYNPSCAYDPVWVCPLAPPGNVLERPIVAGELAPRL